LWPKRREKKVSQTEEKKKKCNSEGQLILQQRKICDVAPEKEKKVWLHYGPERRKSKRGVRSFHNLRATITSPALVEGKKAGGGGGVGGGGGGGKRGVGQASKKGTIIPRKRKGERKMRPNAIKKKRSGIEGEVTMVPTENLKGLEI